MEDKNDSPSSSGDSFETVVGNAEKSPLSQLQHKDQADLLDIIDRLRAAGIQRYICLPQIIVVGDQSAGKSSVLEAICSHPFPTKDSLCTTFATELVLRRASTYRLTVSIIPGPSRSQEDQARLRNFSRSATTATDTLPALVEEATRQIKQISGSSGPLSFTDDVLRVEHSGPSCQQPLTLVDLPGLIHSQSKHQNRLDKDLVWALVKKYMEQPESIILAIVAADNNHANQAVLSLAKQYDPTGRRTLGVITKPDKLHAGSASEDAILALARNEDTQFELGWHILRNRGFDTREASIEERDRTEAEFLAGEPWQTLPSKMRGIKELRDRLSHILYKQSIAGLPVVLENIQALLEDTKTILSGLGGPRPSKLDKQLFLTRISKDFSSMLDAALRGDYSEARFQDQDVTASNCKRLRAQLQGLTREFATTMIDQGHKWDALTGVAGYFNNNHELVVKTSKQEELAAYVMTLQAANARFQLPDTEDMHTISELFREQSRKWESIADDYALQIWETVMNFMRIPLENTNNHTADMILTHVVQHAMDQRKECLKEKVKELLAPYTVGVPMTYNERYQYIVRQYRKNRLEDKGRHGTTLGPELSVAEDICDRTAAYYDIARDTFVDNFVILAIENTLLKDLQTIFSSEVVLTLTDERLELIASEPSVIQQRRADLERKRDVLDEGRRICQRHYSKRAESLVPQLISPASARERKETNVHPHYAFSRSVAGKRGNLNNTFENLRIDDTEQRARSQQTSPSHAKNHMLRPSTPFNLASPSRSRASSASPLNETTPLTDYGDESEGRRPARGAAQNKRRRQVSRTDFGAISSHGSITKRSDLFEAVPSDSEEEL